MAISRDSLPDHVRMEVNRQIANQDRKAAILMTQFHIILPLPARELSPNARCHWGAKAVATRKARTAACACAMAALWRDEPPRWKNAMSQLIFYFKTARRRDADNLLASCKAYCDGLVDAGILADDSGLGHFPVIVHKDKDNPRLEITIERA